MKLRFVDWEIEKNNVEDYYGYDKRYCLDEVISEDNVKISARILVRSNKISDVFQAIAKIALESSEKIEFVPNDSLEDFQHLLK